MRAEELSWGGSDGPKFQRFCNALIYIVVSKHAKLYTAPGPDGGVDQYYIGSWNGYDGKFRFQDKYHGGVDRKRGFTLLKGDVRTDIEEHAADENFIVYLTDVSLNHNEVTELENIAATALGAKGITVLPTVLFWHGGTLDTMVQLSPLLRNQFFDTGHPLLETYRESFAPQLTSDDLRYQLNNRFFGRQQSLDDMTAFLHGTDTTLMVIGVGNIGKTRAVLHFFQTVVDQNDEWIALVLKPEGYSAATFSNLLLENRKMVILLDDAHRHSQLLSSIKTEIDKRGGQVKLILTCRTDLYQDVKHSIPTHARSFKENVLQPLTRTETKEIYRSLLPEQPEGNLIWLRDQSSGVPGVIVAHCYLIRNMGHPTDVPAEDAFNDYVTGIVKEAIDSVEARTNFDKRKIRELIELIALLAPLPVGDPSNEALAGMLGITADEVAELLAALVDGGLVAMDRFISIKPDPVSDTILREFYQRAAPKIKKIVRRPDVLSLFSKIVDNLSAFPLAAGDHRTFISSLLSEYINRFDDPSVHEQDIRNILQTATRLAFRMPEVAVEAIEKFLVLYADRSHPLHQKTSFATESPLQKLRSDVAVLLKALFTSADDDQSLPGYFSLFRQCVQVLEYPSMMYPCFGYRQWDFESSRLRSGPCCHRQLFLAGRVAPFFTSDDAHEVELALAAFKCLFKLDYLLEEAFDPATGQFFYGEGFIQDCPHVRTVRLQLLTGLIGWHRKYRRTSEKAGHWMTQLARILIYQYAIKSKKTAGIPSAEASPTPGRPRSTVDQTPEVHTVTAYFRELLSGDATAAERADIIRYNQIGEIRELKPKFATVQQELQRLLTAGSLDQRLELFLTAVIYRSNERKAELRQLAGEYDTATALATAVKRIVSANPHLNSTPINDLAHYLGADHPAEAAELFGFIIDHTPGYVSAFSVLAGYFLDQDMPFYSWIDKITAIDAGLKPNQIIVSMLLSPRRVAEGGLNRQDLPYIARAVEDPETAPLPFLDYDLYRYAMIDESKTTELLMKYIAKHKHRGLGDIISSMTSDEAFAGERKDFILHLLRHCTTYCSTTDVDFLPGLHFIRVHQGDEALFEFVKADVERRNGEGLYIFDRGVYRDLDPYPSRCQLFRTFLAWLVRIGCVADDTTTNDLLHFFLPPRPADADEAIEFSRFFSSLIGECKDLPMLKRIALAIKGRVRYNENTLSLQCRLIDQAMAQTPAFADAESLLGSGFIDNIDGPRTGFGHGQPYQEDLQKAVFLTEFLQKNVVSLPIRSALEKALKNVAKSIEEATRVDAWP